MVTDFRQRFGRDPIFELGEPCAHGGSPVDCASCTAEMIAELPSLSRTRCASHRIEDLAVVKAHCSHGASKGRLGRALVCAMCGWSAHQWSGYIICGRGRPKPGEIEAENARCPIHERLVEQKRQAMPAWDP